MSFINELKNSQKLKISYNDKFYNIPSHVLNIGRDITFEALEIDVNESNYPAPLEKAAKVCFQTFINEYLEASVPAQNPGGRHRAERVFEIFPELMNVSDGFVRKHLNAVNSEQALMNGFVLKSGVFKIVDPFLQGVLKMPKSTVQASDFSAVKPEDLGRNFVKNSGKSDAIGKIVINRYLQSVATVWVMAFAKKMFEQNNAVIRDAVDSALANHSYKDLIDKKNLAAFLSHVKQNIETQLANIDFASTVK
jgi:hypothetical protein